MPQKLFFAIETLPPDKKYLDKYIQKHIEEYELRFPLLSREEAEKRAHDEFIDLASTGEYGQLFVFCILLERENGNIFRGLVGDNNTLETLSRFWSMVEKLNPSTDLLIGYNIRKVVLPFLCKKSAQFETYPPPHDLCFTNNRTRFVFDILDAWNHGADRDISLPLLGEFLHLNSLEDKRLLDNSQVYEASLAGRYKEITEKCLLKVDLIRTIYYRLTFQKKPPLTIIGSNPQN